MRLAFTPDQRDLHDAVRALLADTCPPEVVQESWSTGLPDTGLWLRLAELGLPLALVPEALGGLGLDEVDLVGCFEASGAACLPLPLAETTAVAAPLLAAIGREDLVERMGAGQLRVTADFDGSGLLPFAAGAGAVLLDDGELWWLPDLDDPVVVPEASVDRTRPLRRVTARPASAERLVPDPDLVGRAWRGGVLATSAQLVGLSGAMLSMAVEHVTTREQFGVPVGSFQAVKHHLADALVAIELARPLVHTAAWSMASHSDDADRDVAAAKAVASDAAVLAARTALQCHGAMGYTTEHRLHLWMKRAWALAASWGDSRSQRRRLAGHLGLSR